MTTSSDFYVGMRGVADKLLKKFGMPAILRRVGANPEDRPCIVAIVDFLPHERSSSLANPTDRRVLLSAATPEIQAIPPDSELDQLVTFIQPAGTIQNEVLPMTCKPKLYAPAGVPVLYEFTVRQ